MGLAGEERNLTGGRAALFEVLQLAALSANNASGPEDPGRDKIHASIMASIVPSPNIEIPTRVCLIKLHSASQ